MFYYRIYILNIMKYFNLISWSFEYFSSNILFARSISNKIAKTGNLSWLTRSRARENERKRAARYFRNESDKNGRRPENTGARSCSPKS